MKLLNLKVTTLLVALVLAPSAMAQNVMMSEDAAMKNFKEAAKLFREGEVDTTEPVNKVDAEKNTAEKVKSKSKVSIIKQQEIDLYEQGFGTEYQSIEDIDVSINIENETIENVVKRIIEGSREKSGKWIVKWRVSSESSYVLSERVNLTAETNLSNFMSYLVDRVNNMTGVKLFVTVFDKSRIILISDTYY
ncbi:MAG: hypothetical protein ACI9TY_001384 [Alphaproteobacteria bacterium]|jgi:hypothetical protein